jgi:peptide/nickel transport system substrate-binding protein
MGRWAISLPIESANARRRRPFGDWWIWLSLLATVLAVGVPCVGGAAAQPAPSSTRFQSVQAIAPIVTTHGIAMHGAPALPRDFTHLPYVNPDAPKGGRIVLGQHGTFDSLTPFIVRGVAAAGLRDYVYESLLGRSLDEPFSLYGLLANAIEVPPDRSYIVFHLDPRARFSDGRPVTTDDVIFSWEQLKEKGLPYMRAHYQTVRKATVVEPGAVRFDFDTHGNREAPLLLGLMPVLPKHRFDAATFEQTSLEPPIGSGPYTVGAVDAGRSITYRRNPDWWGRDLPINRGRFNFDEVRYDYYRDAAALFEAFKSGQISLRPEEDPTRWAEGLALPAVADGRAKIAEFDIAVPAGMAALAFNTRRWPFTDARVRQALIAMFDFEWINRNLYHGSFTRTQSYFERSVLASTGRPADARERELLRPFAALIKPDVLEGTWRLPSSDGTGHNRENLSRGVALLKAAGFALQRGRMLASDGRPLAFEILASSRAQERLMLTYTDTLRRLGIDVRVRQADSSQYQERLKTFDFDMIQANWPASLSPGNEQINRWGSLSADNERSLNYPGVKNPAVDAMIKALLTAEAREDFEAAVRALDRALLSGDYVIPLFHAQKQWVAYWAHLHPAPRPTLYGFNIDTWWSVEK